MKLGKQCMNKMRSSTNEQKPLKKKPQKSQSSKNNDWTEEFNRELQYHTLPNRRKNQ